jgi:hypothetical protein
MEVSGQLHCSFSERVLSAHWTGGCVGQRASLDTMKKRKITCIYQELNPTYAAHCLFVIATELKNLNNFFLIKNYLTGCALLIIHCLAEE